MHNQDDSMDKSTTYKTDLQVASQEEKGVAADGKMMLLFGGMMAVCCAVPLLLASGLSLAWFTESPALAGGVAAIAAVLLWRLSRKGSACSHAKPPAGKAAIPSDQA